LTAGHEAYGAAQTATFELIAHAAELSASKLAVHGKDPRETRLSSGQLPEPSAVPVPFEGAPPATIGERGRSIERECQPSRLR
jgi:hypothetical protein